MSRPAPSEPAQAAAVGAPARVGALALFTLGLLFVARPVRADGPEVAELHYERPAELAACPDEVSFRRAVSERLRRDPFVTGAARKISVSLKRSGVTLTALVRVEEAGHASGERRIDARASCEELAAGAALAVSIAIDPSAALGLASENDSARGDASQAEAKPAPTPPKPATSPKLAKEPAPGAATKASDAPSRQPEAGENRIFARAGVRAWLGIVPKLSVGPSLGLGYQRGHGSLALDAIAVLPQTESVPDTRRAVSVDLLGAQLSPCAHLAALRGCAVLGLGALFARGEGVDHARTGASFYAAAGLGVGYSFFAGRFSLTPILEGSARLASAVLSIDDQPAWTTPRLVGSLGLELSYELTRD